MCRLHVVLYLLTYIFSFPQTATSQIYTLSLHDALPIFPNTHLVMHGSSSVPQELLDEIREFGGEMKETYGVPVKEIQEAIKYGVRKVNIDTAIRLAMTAALRRFMHDNPSAFDPRDYIKAAREASKAICKARYEQLGAAGNASKIKPIPLTQMAQQYSSGALAQQVQ